MTDDSLQADTGLRTLPTDEINYMRNAVKATVDAYDGTVTLYEWDEEDPILKAWRSAFPGTVLAEVGDLRRADGAPALPRGPVQGAALPVRPLPRRPTRRDFYNGNNRWEVPEDPNSRGPPAAAVPPLREPAGRRRRDRRGLLADVDLRAVRQEQPRGVRLRRLRRDRRDDYGKMRVLAAAGRARPRVPARSRTSSPPTRTSPTCCASSDRSGDPADLRQPAHAAGRRRADLRRAGLRRARRVHRRAIRSSQLRARLLRRRGRRRSDADRGARRRARRRGRRDARRPASEPGRRRAANGGEEAPRSRTRSATCCSRPSRPSTTPTRPSATATPSCGRR